MHRFEIDWVATARSGTSFCLDTPPTQRPTEQIPCRIHSDKRFARRLSTWKPIRFTKNSIENFDFYLFLFFSSFFCFFCNSLVWHRSFHSFIVKSSTISLWPKTNKQRNVASKFFHPSAIRPRATIDLNGIHWMFDKPFDWFINWTLEHIEWLHLRRCGRARGWWTSQCLNIVEKIQNINDVSKKRSICSESDTNEYSFRRFWAVTSHRNANVMKRKRKLLAFRLLIVSSVVVTMPRHTRRRSSVFVCRSRCWLSLNVLARACVCCCVHFSQSR